MSETTGTTDRPTDEARSDADAPTGKPARKPVKRAVKKPVKRPAKGAAPRAQSRGQDGQHGHDDTQDRGRPQDQGQDQDQDRDQDRDQDEGSRRSRPKGTRLAVLAAEQLVGLTGKDFEGIVGLSRSDDGWSVAVEVLEMRRIPNTTDVIAVYEVDVDEDGDLTGYRRLRRFLRGEAGDDR